MERKYLRFRSFIPSSHNMSVLEKKTCVGKKYKINRQFSNQSLETVHTKS